MASCAAGKTSRVYGQYTELICKLMVRTWGYLFEANEKKNIKNTCEPSKIYFPFMWTLLHPPSHVCLLYLFQLFVPILLWSPHVTSRTLDFNGRQCCREGRSCLRSEVGGRLRAGGPAPWSLSASGSWLGLIPPRLRLLGWPPQHFLVF